MKFATKFMRNYPPHLKHFATLPWEIKIQIFCKYLADMEKCKQIAFYRFKLCCSKIKIGALKIQFLCISYIF